MQNISKLLLFFFAATVMVACSDDKDNDGPSSKPSSKMTTTYRDTLAVSTDWSASTVSAQEEIDGFTIHGVSTSPNETFTISLNSLTVGDHHDAIIIFRRIHAVDTTYYMNGSWIAGSYAGVSITSIDTANHTVSGTFEYALYNPDGDEDFIYNVNIEEETGIFENIPYDPYDPTVSIGEGSIAVMVDGTSKTDNNAMGMTIGDNILLTGYFNGGSESLSISIPGSIGVGTHELGGSVSGLSVMYTSNNSYISTAGTVVITTHNTTTKTIAGTFSGTVMDFVSTQTLELTNGNFSMSY